MEAYSMKYAGIRKDGIYKSFVEGRQEAASWKIA